MVSLNLDLHGCYPDEIEYRIGGFISECRAYKATDATIIHGKGEGVLKKTVLNELKRYSKDIRCLVNGEDGSGGSVRVKFNVFVGKTLIYKAKKPGNIEVDNKKKLNLNEEIVKKKEKARNAYNKRMGRLS